MDSVLEWRSFVPELRNMDRKDDKSGIKDEKAAGKNYHYVAKQRDENWKEENSAVSLYAWVNINQVNSRAGIGTLAFNGFAKNFQVSAMFGRSFNHKPELTHQHNHHHFHHRHKHYEGSLNMRVDTCTGQIFENDMQ